MPNRIIKESICTSDTLSQLTAEEERLFYRLIVNCEDYGRMEARPEIVRAKCFPLLIDKISVQQVQNWLNKLAALNLIVLYTNNGKLYLEFLTWHDHQPVRAAKAKYPGPEDEGSQLLEIDITCNQVKSCELPNDQSLQNPNIRNTNTNIRKDRRSKASDDKIEYAEYVRMTETEYNRLVEKHGEELTREFIAELDNYKGARPSKRKYESDYRAILNWVVEKVYKKHGIPLNKADPVKKKLSQDNLTALQLVEQIKQKERERKSDDDV